MSRHLVPAAIVGAVLLVASATTSAAAAPAVSAKPPASIDHGTVSGPTPQDYPPFDDPAGTVCPFGLHGEFPVNHVVGYTYTNSRGRVVAAYYTGALYLRVTRVDTGATVTKNISGSGVQTFASDGSSVHYGVGPFASSQHVGDDPGPELAVLHGVSALAIGADGHKTIRYSSRVENVCNELR